MLLKKWPGSGKQWKLILSVLGIMFVMFGVLSSLPADAQGLVGAPVDTHHGSSQVGLLADYGYDQARDVSRAVTAATALLCFGIGCFRMGKVKGKRLAKEICGLAIVPVAVHLAGTFAINNFGGLGGCPVASIEVFQ
ncbi:MAG: hypothetical protein JST01_16370 [Cyanobacteria bacterium SZAS TMP-1]|nr:hypothetical protein [Cyanobacteria bacterium SZAS TMP-1]